MSIVFFSQNKVLGYLISTGWRCADQTFLRPSVHVIVILENALNFSMDYVPFTRQKKSKCIFSLKKWKCASHEDELVKVIRPSPLRPALQWVDLDLVLSELLGASSREGGTSRSILLPPPWMRLPRSSQCFYVERGLHEAYEAGLENQLRFCGLLCGMLDWAILSHKRFQFVCTPSWDQISRHAVLIYLQRPQSLPSED